MIDNLNGKTINLKEWTNELNRSKPLFEHRITCVLMRRNYIKP